MPNLCVIVPCYNEAFRLPLRTFQEYINNNDFYFCFVNDGSTDNTLVILNELANSNQERISVVNLKRNVGKAEAVRQGVQKAFAWKEFDYLAYFDADLAVPLIDIEHLYNYAKLHQEVFLVMGARLKRLGAIINRSPLRHFFGRIFATFASNLFKIDAYDTQCGLKLFKREIVRDIFDDTFYSRWFFDIEILLRFKMKVSRNKSFDGVCEIPLSAWEEVEGSKLKLRDFVLVPFELIQLKRKYNKK